MVRDRTEINKPEEQEQQAQAGVVEVAIDLPLINNKLNYLIAKLDELSHLLKKS